MGGNHKRTDPKLSKAHTRHDMCVIVGGNIIHGRRMVSSFGGHTHTMRRKLLPVAEGNLLLNSHNNLQLALNIYSEAVLALFDNYNADVIQSAVDGLVYWAKSCCCRLNESSFTKWQ